MMSSDHTAKHEEAVAICGGWNPEPAIVTVMSALPAIAVASDSELIESTAGVGPDGGVTIGGCSEIVGRVGV